MQDAQSNIEALCVIQELLRAGQDIGLDYLLSITSDFKTSELEEKISSLLKYGQS